MRAIVIREPGPADVLELRDVPTPEPARGEVRVRVRATAVNRADILQRLGRYPPPTGVPVDIPGLEVAGEIDAVGDGVTRFKPGDRVLGLVGGGAYAEYVVAHARALARLGPTLPYPDAAAIPEAFLTAWDAIVGQAGLTAGETLLVHAAGSGVGTAAIQIANAVGATAIGTTRTAEKLARARELGLAWGTCVDEDGLFAARVREQTGDSGVDVVLDLVGGPYVAESLACLAMRGRIVAVGALAGTRTTLDLGVLMKLRAEVRGTMLRSRELEEKILLAQTLEQRLMPLFDRGRLRPIVHRVFDLQDAAEAHRVVESNAIFGKVVLTVR
jgi:putative PIG3 family NAD(P)H quinone oxidoreductase